MNDVQKAKKALDTIIRKSRVHLYKPIQIAEILYHNRTGTGASNLLNLEEYRNISKKWRDEISVELLGRKCTSSARFQDDLFNDNAIPPYILEILGRENIKTGGSVESYIYRCFSSRHTQLSSALDYCVHAENSEFDIKFLIDSFRREPGLRRSIDKVYEIIVYALFETILTALELKIEITVNPQKHDVMTEFSDFTKLVMKLDDKDFGSPQNAEVFRVGVTNAADRGLDIYSNWGPAIQVKHLSLSEETAEDIVNNAPGNKIIIVCKDAEEKIITSLLNQIGWRNRIQSIITETNLINWYDKALRGKYSGIMADELMSSLCVQLQYEFPSVTDFPDTLKNRHYENITNEFWK
ncbi:MAG: HaeII family restriction endonuclease [Ruminococcus sp.]|jgi:type II restriction enzyme|nr:HaeII family restriction endonuclease [Ruminococcus sp.]